MIIWTFSIDILFTAEPQSAQRIFVLCLPLRGPAIKVGVTDQFDILACQPPANIKGNPPQAQKINYAWRSENSRRIYCLKGVYF